MRFGVMILLVVVLTPDGLCLPPPASPMLLQAKAATCADADPVADGLQPYQCSYPLQTNKSAASAGPPRDSVCCLVSVVPLQAA